MTITVPVTYTEIPTGRPASDFDPAPIEEPVSSRKEKVEELGKKIQEKIEEKAEELRKTYTGVAIEVPQVQKLYLALSDQEQSLFRRWLKGQLKGTPPSDPVEAILNDIRGLSSSDYQRLFEAMWDHWPALETYRKEHNR